MNILEEKILAEGTVREGNVLIVDSFLNHRVDVILLQKIADDVYSRFGETGITKILTIESSGIPFATLVALKFGVPFVFAKKSRGLNLVEDTYRSSVFSFTHQCSNDVFVSKSYLSPSDRILIVDDFLAHGEAMVALCNIVLQSGAEIVGLCPVIEKGYMGGGKMLRNMGYHVESIVIIDEMDSKTGTISFR